MAKRPWLRRTKPEEPEQQALPPAEPDTMEPPSEDADQTERERQLHGLAVLSLFLHSTATVEEMTAMLLEQAPTVTGAVFVYPLLLDRKRQLLRASGLEGCNDSKLETAMDAFQEDLTALEFSLAQNQELFRIVEDGEVVLRDDFGVLMEGVLPEEQWKPAQETLQVRKLAFVPMVVESEPLGLVVFAFDRNECDVEALELLVGHLTLALRDLLVRDEAVRFSDIDPVTWVHNRRYLKQVLESEMMRAGRYGRGLSLVLLDIDNFTEFNTSYGQSLGDRLLRMVATTLAETVSPPELVARIKDDDFAVLLPETNRAAAVTTTTRLLASLAQVSVFSSGDEEAQPVTVSVAIACFPEDGNTPQALLERAMADLAAAKREEEQPADRHTVDPIARVAAQRQAQ
ncbi:MAG: GGDEF domain-containing protein [Chloroflexi bacterium]|nr:GGDEF domain-containing protein [Chloroflexota bacterium]